jgi:DNA adenine methylase
MATNALPNTARPFLKWAGGKRQLLEQFAPLYPARIERYIEPFAGSAAVFFDVRERFDLRFAALSDDNAELINCYRIVRDDVEALIKKLRAHKKRHHEEFPSYFYGVREQLPDRLSPVARAARFIYLNKTGYNGLYRVNAAGRFNVPVGRYKDPPICDAELLRAASAALQGVNIDVRDFGDWLSKARAGDFFYIDPPYVPLSKTSNFTSYAAGGFGAAEQVRLARFVRDLDGRGARVMLSNSDTPIVRKLYGGFDIKKINARRNINSNGARRGQIAELVIRNYTP